MGRQVPYSELERKLIIRMWREGKSAREISDAVAKRFRKKRTRNAVIGLVNRSGLPPRQKPTPRIAPIQKAAPKSAPSSAPARKAPGVTKMTGGAVFGAAQSARRARAEARQIPEPKPKPPQALPAPVLTPRNLTILEVTDQTCRYPVTDAPPHRFCGHPPLTGKVYCEAHHALILRKEEAA